MEKTEVLILVGVIVPLIKIIEVLIIKLIGKGVTPLSQDEREMLKSIHKLATKTDNDGQPLMWLPRSALSDIGSIKSYAAEQSILQKDLIAVQKEILHEIRRQRLKQ